MSPKTLERVRAHLKKHHTRAHRPASLARELREKDVRQVRLALERMRSAGEVVSCKVVAGGVEDEEFRISCGGPAFLTRPSLIPDPALRMRDPGAELSPAASRAVLRLKIGPKGGHPPTRQRAVLAFCDSIGRPVFPREIVEHFAKLDEPVSRDAVYTAVRLLKLQGELVLCGKRRDSACPKKGKLPLYATPEVAARAELDTQGSGGEAGNGKAAHAAAAPGGDEATRPSAQKTAPNGAGGNADPLFGVLSDGAILIRGVWLHDVTMPAPGARALLGWFDRLAGSNLVGRLLP